MADYPVYVLRIKPFEIRRNSLSPVKIDYPLPFVHITSVPKEVSIGRTTEEYAPMIDLKFQTISRRQGRINFMEIGQDVVYFHESKTAAQVRWGVGLSEYLQVSSGQAVEMSTSLGSFSSSLNTPESLQIKMQGPVLRYSLGPNRILDIDIIQIGLPRAR
jgi:hypothetical protein